MSAEQQPANPTDPIYPQDYYANVEDYPPYSPPYAFNDEMRRDYFAVSETYIAASRRFDLMPDKPNTLDDSNLCSQVDPEIFFPEKGGSTKAAKMICSRCIVQPECLDYVLKGDGQPYGVWGYRTEVQIRSAKRTQPEIITNRNGSAE
jgi:WhiB family redox-sensing transcriptional regulator